MHANKIKNKVESNKVTLWSFNEQRSIETLVTASACVEQRNIWNEEK